MATVTGPVIQARSSQRYYTGGSSSILHVQTQTDPGTLGFLSQTKDVAKNISHVYLKLTFRGPMKIIFCPMLSTSKKDIGFGRIPGFVCSSD